MQTQVREGRCSLLTNGLGVIIVSSSALPSFRGTGGETPIGQLRNSVFLDFDQDWARHSLGWRRTVRTGRQAIGWAFKVSWLPCPRHRLLHRCPRRKVSDLGIISLQTQFETISRNQILFPSHVSGRGIDQDRRRSTPIVPPQGRQSSVPNPSWDEPG